MRLAAMLEKRRLRRSEVSTLQTLSGRWRTRFFEDSISGKLILLESCMTRHNYQVVQVLGDKLWVGVFGSADSILCKPPLSWVGCLTKIICVLGVSEAHYFFCLLRKFILAQLTLFCVSHHWAEVSCVLIYVKPTYHLD